MVRRKDTSHFSLIDWDYQSEDSRTYVHEICWYPARFIPIIPAQLIAALSRKGDTVLDPFCGAGTTVVEALKTDRSAIGSDLNPIAKFLTSVKSRLLLQKSFSLIRLQELAELIEDAREGRRPAANMFATTSYRMVESIREQSIPHFDENSGWYHANTLRELAFIFLNINALPGGLVRDVAKALFLGVLNSSTAYPGGRSYTYYADNVKPKEEKIYKDALKLYVSRLYRFISQREEIKYRISPQTTARVYQVDVRRLSDVVDSEVDIVITSPPYLNVTDYSTGFRLAYLWYDFVDDLRLLKNMEIGPRAKRHGKRNLETYLEDMNLAFANIVQTLKPKGYLCLVLGEPKKYFSTIRQNLVDNICADLGLSLQDSYSRQISKNFFYNKKGGVREEEIIILRN